MTSWTSSSDDGEVAGDDTEHVAGLARSDHRHTGLGGDRDGTVLRMGCRTRHGDDDLVEAETGIVHRERGQALHLGGGRDDGNAYAVLPRSLCGGLELTDVAVVVGQHDDLVGARSRSSEALIAAMVSG